MVASSSAVILAFSSSQFSWETHPPGLLSRSSDSERSEEEEVTRILGPSDTTADIAALVSLSDTETEEAPGTRGRVRGRLVRQMEVEVGSSEDSEKMARRAVVVAGVDMSSMDTRHLPNPPPQPLDHQDTV